MHCKHARLLCGVREELDAPSRRALSGHLRDCPDCAAYWIEEDQFRKLMAEQPEPRVSALFEAALLAIPAGDWRWLRLRTQVADKAPLLLTLAALGLAGLGLSRMAPAPLGSEIETAAPALESGAGSASEAAHNVPPEPVTRVSQPIQNQPMRLQDWDPLDALHARALRAKAAAPQRVAQAAPAVAPSAAASELIAAPEAPAVSEPVAEAAPPEDMAERESETERDAQEARQPEDPEPSQPAIEPPPAPWILILEARMEGATAPAEGYVVAHLDRDDGASGWRTVQEIVLELSGPSQHQIELIRGQRYQLEIFGNPAGFELCAGSARVRALQEQQAEQDGLQRTDVRFCARPTETPTPVPEPPGPPGPPGSGGSADLPGPGSTPPSQAPAPPQMP